MQTETDLKAQSGVKTKTYQLQSSQILIYGASLKLLFMTDLKDMNDSNGDDDTTHDYTDAFARQDDI